MANKQAIVQNTSYYRNNTPLLYNYVKHNSTCPEGYINPGEYIKPGETYLLICKQSGWSFMGMYVKWDTEFKAHEFKIFREKSIECEYEDDDDKRYIRSNDLKKMIINLATGYLIAKQVARGLCDRIPEDCAGIIERMLVGDSIVGHGPDRYPERVCDANGVYHA